MLGDKGNRFSRAVVFFILAVLFANFNFAHADEQVKLGLISLVPDGACVIIERRGHTKVKSALDASNTGKLYNDEAIRDFLDATREAIGKKIAAEMFDLEDEDEITTVREQFHQVLLPFWYDRSVMFFLPPQDKEKDVPDMGIIVVPSPKYRKGCIDSLKALMEKNAAPATQPGKLQSFTYTSEKVTWTGVVHQDEEFVLPEDQTERKEVLDENDVFMITQRHPMVYITTSIYAADQISKTMSASEKKNTNPGLKTVFAKTAMTDWAMRWFLDIKAIAEISKDDDPETFLQNKYMKVLGLDTLRSAGGYIGYIDNTLANKTYIDALGIKGGLLRCFKAGGDFKAGLSMLPSHSSFMLGGEFNPKTIAKIVTEIFKISNDEDEEIVVVIEDEDEEIEAEEEKTDSQDIDKVKKFTELFNELAAAVGPNAGGYVTDIQTMMMGTPPVGMVFEIKDKARAEKAIRALCEFAGMEERLPDTDDSDENEAATTKPAAKYDSYRKAVIHRMDDQFFYSVMEDRMIIAFSDGALKAGIDAGKDKMGGFAPDSKAAKLGTKLPKGPGIFMMDLPALTKLAWPMLVQSTQEGDNYGPFGFLRSLPSTQKITSLLEPEMVVFIPDEGGLLLNSRGVLPFGSKLPVGYAGAGYFVMMMHMR
jgi:hypothetical protein